MLCGGSLELTLAHAGVSIRCLQLWIRRFNQSGIDGITYRPKPGRPRLMESGEISEKILPVVDDPKSADRHHWTAIAFCGWLKDNKELVMSSDYYYKRHGYDPVGEHGQAHLNARTFGKRSIWSSRTSATSRRRS
jgi:hypothetical protein